MCCRARAAVPGPGRAAAAVGERAQLLRGAHDALGRGPLALHHGRLRLQGLHAVGRAAQAGGRAQPRGPRPRAPPRPPRAAARAPRPAPSAPRLAAAVLVLTTSTNYFILPRSIALC